MTTAGTERRKSKKYYQNRERVIDIAVELFSKQGYASTGVADLGTAAGLARGALYYYIGSKEALLAEIHNRVMDPLLAEAAAIAEEGLSFRAELRMLSESLLWQIIHRHDHVWVFLHEYHQLEGEYREVFRAKRAQFTEYIHKTLARGAKQKQVYVTDVELTTLAFLNLHNYTYQWLGGRGDLEVEKLSRFYCQIFLDGISTKPVSDSRDPELKRGRAVLQRVREEFAAAAEA